MLKRALLASVGVVVAALVVSAAPALAEPAADPAAPATTTAVASPPAGTYDACPRPSRPDEMQCMAVVRAAANSPMGLQPSATPAGYGPDDLHSAYALPSGSGGEGQTVAIVDAYHNPSAEADLAVYRAQYGLPPCTGADGCFTQVDQRGGDQWAAYDAGWAGEISLDLDMVSAICPSCRILLVEADTASGSDLYAAEDQAISMGARFISNSWGGNESPDQMQDGDPHFDHPGVAITAATGDQGFPGSYPASSQYVTAVGGTSLVRDANSPRGWTETAWRLAGSTCSPWEPTPSFQNEAMTDCTKRATADVSAVADPGTGVAVYDQGWHVYGGTSVASPIIASVYALAGAPLTGSRPNELPYRHPDALNDVTSGSNGCYGFKFCNAGPGWDGPSGLGTPNGLTAFSPGPHGELTGTVKDGAQPVSGATVSAGGQQVTSGSQGEFALTLPPGGYTLTVTKFGYAPHSDQVGIADGQTVTENVRINALPRATVSGRVLDGSGHGWPVYASVQVHGEPSTRTFTDPVTGAYRMSLPRDASYDLDVTPVYRGYAAQTQPVTVGATSVAADVRLTVPFASCNALGYGYTSTPASVQPFDGTSTPDGWTLVDSLGRGLLWRFDDPAGRGNLTGGTGNFAILDSDYANPTRFQDTSLVSPAWDLSGLTHPALTFHTDYFGMSNSRATVELSTDGGQSWTQLWIHQTDSVRGPDLETIDLTPWAGQSSVQVRFRYQGYEAWWWEVDDVTLAERACSPRPGGMVVGDVTDKNTGSGLTGASVRSEDGSVAATTVATPDDPALTEGRYWFFAPAGSYPLTATEPGGYVAVTQAVPVVADGVASARFALPAGQLSVSRTDIARTLTLGDDAKMTLRVKNTGTAPATVALREVPGGATPMSVAASAPTQRIPGQFRPGLEAGAPTAVGSGAVTPQAAPWQTVADYPIPIFDNAMATDGGTLYSVGGVSTTGVPLARSYRYDPGAAEWTRLPDMQQARAHPAVAFLDGKLYVAGGWDDRNDQVQPTMEIYDPATGAWSSGPDMITGVAAAGVAVLDNRMYVIGGCTTLESCNEAGVQAYDPTTNGWEPAASYPQPVVQTGCGTIAARIYCAGGISDSTGASRDGWAYDPNTDHWSQIAGLPYGDQWGMASTAADGRLLLVGGVIQHSGLITNEGWAYDPATNTWSSLPNANTVSYRSAGACGFYKVGGIGVGVVANAEMLPGYGDCATAGDVSWLSVDPTGAQTLAPGESVDVTVRLDASVDQPGSYAAGLALSEDTPYPYVALPVTMTVEPPASWGKLAGTVTGTTCAGNTVAISGATVTISGDAQSYTLKTGADGTYQLWLDARQSPFSVVVGKDGWTPTGVSDVRLLRGRTTTEDFALVPSSGC